MCLDTEEICEAVYHFLPSPSNLCKIVLEKTLMHQI